MKKVGCTPEGFGSLVCESSWCKVLMFVGRGKFMRGSFRGCACTTQSKRDVDM